MVAPFIPFISEEIYKNLAMPEDPISVHLTDYPAYHKELRDEHLELAMEKVQQAVSLGHALRKEHQLKVRQPLKQAFIVSSNAKTLALLQEESALIADELNVQQVVFSSDESQFVSVKVKPNFRVLGKKVGKLMKALQAYFETLSDDEVKAMLDKKPVDITIEGQTITIGHEDIEIQREVKADLVALNAQDITVALDTHLDDELLELGLVREIVNKINLMRKEVNLEISDRIHVTLASTDRVRTCINKHQEFISQEILALSFTFSEVTGEEIDLNGEKAVIVLKKAEYQPHGK